MGKLYNAAYNTLNRFDSFMRNLGQPKVDAVTEASPTAKQAIKKNPSIAAHASATAKGIPTITSGSPLSSLSVKPTTKRKKVSSPHSFGGSGGSSGSESTSAKQEFHYYEAPLAKMYGFSPETAYQEALANTSIRREMNDMRKAGINPSVIYGSHNSSGADSGILPRETSSGSGGGGRDPYRRSGKSNSGKYLFSGGAYYGTMAAVGTVVSIATKNVGAGMAAAGLAGTAMKALNGAFKKK